MPCRHGIMLVCPTPTVYMPPYPDVLSLWILSGKSPSSFRRLRSQPNHHQLRQKYPFVQGRGTVLKVSEVVIFLYKFHSMSMCNVFEVDMMVRALEKENCIEHTHTHRL